MRENPFYAVIVTVYRNTDKQFRLYRLQVVQANGSRQGTPLIIVLALLELVHLQIKTDCTPRREWQNQTCTLTTTYKAHKMKYKAFFKRIIVIYAYSSKCTCMRSNIRLYSVYFLRSSYRFRSYQCRITNCHAIQTRRDNCTFFARNPKFSISIFRLKNGKVGGYQKKMLLGWRAEKFSFVKIKDRAT